MSLNQKGIEKNADKRLVRMAEDVKAANRAFDALAVKVFRPGRRVCWVHGRHWRHGTVLEVSTCGYAHTMVFLRTDTNPRVCIRANRILDHLVMK